MLTECLLWEKSTKSSGYGQVWTDGKNQPAHRVAWQALYGEIPADKVLDHMCHNEAAKRGECEGNECIHRLCYNPNHLRLVTKKENTRAGIHSLDVRGFFKCGHEFTETNTHTRKTGGRACGVCSRARAKRYYHEIVKAR